MPRLYTALMAGLAAVAACAHPTASTTAASPQGAPSNMNMSPGEPMPDPRVGLKAGLYDAGQALWNMSLVSTVKSPGPFEGKTNSDLAFIGNYAIQGNYYGFVVWDIGDPAHPTLKTSFV